MIADEEGSDPEQQTTMTSRSSKTAKEPRLSAAPVNVVAGSRALTRLRHQQRGEQRAHLKKVMNKPRLAAAGTKQRTTTSHLHSKASLHRHPSFPWQRLQGGSDAHGTVVAKSEEDVRFSPEERGRGE